MADTLSAAVTRLPAWVRALALLCIGFVCGTLTTSVREEPLADVESDVLPDLVRPPAGLGVVPVYQPVAGASLGSIADARGAVHNLRIGGFRFNVLVSEAGTMRSGDCHKRTQLDMIFEGRVRVTLRRRGRDVQREYGGGEFVAIPANVPHIFEFLNRTVMAEWWDGDGYFETRFYTPYRQRVDAALQARTRAHRRRSSGL